MKRFGKSLLAGAAALALTLTGCASNSAEQSDPLKDNTVKLGVVGASDPYWADFVAAAKKENINVELKDFTDYNQLNPAVSQGELDINQFQHIQYLADYNVSNNDNLVAIGSTAIYPLALFSTKHKTLADIPQGGTVAIPSDPTNRARALNVLQQAKLVKLTDGGTLLSTPDEIDPAKSKVTVTEMDASFTATSLADVDAAVVNNDFVTDAGLKFSDALFQDDPNADGSKPFINIFAVRKADANNKTLNKLVEIYQNTKKVQDGVVKNSGDSAILVKTSKSELAKILADAEAQIKKAKS